MFFFMSILMVVIGAILFTSAKKTAKNNKPLAICFRIIGIILVLAGLWMVYFGLSGRMILPLSIINTTI